MRVLEEVEKKPICRNPAIELYRILLMFGICLLHSVCQGRYMHHWPWNVLGCCVPGFVFISGYFGIRFSLSKVIRLYSIAIYASLLAPLVGGAWTRGYWHEVIRVWHADGGFWFVHAYVLLMVMSPFVNSVFEKCKLRESVTRILPLLFVVFIWGCLLNYNRLTWLISSSPGLKPAESCLTFVAVYCVGRCVRMLRVDERIAMWIKLFVTVFLIAVISVSQGYLKAGNNPLCVLLAVMLFMLLKEIYIPPALSRVIRFFSPFMFSVYCISGTIYFPFMEPKFFSVIEWCKDALAERGASLAMTLISATGVAFLVGIVFALPQWLAARIFRHCLVRFYSFVDGIPEGIAKWLENV